MSQTIVFISGFMVPEALAKSSFVWDDQHWKGYNRIYLPSKTPTSDRMVDRELDRLCKLVNQFPDVVVAGHSLGAWWATNLACHSESKIKKLVCWTPLVNANIFPFFNVTPRHYPLNKLPNKHNMGPANAAIFHAKNDWILPYELHSFRLGMLLNATIYDLNGGHCYQTNHKAGLHFMKDWIELG
jgi:pimeloyl-ACP methyl ester carboxylesterase